MWNVLRQQNKNWNTTMISTASFSRSTKTSRNKVAIARSACRRRSAFRKQLEPCCIFARPQVLPACRRHCGAVRCEALRTPAVTSVSETIWKAPLAEAQTALENKNTFCGTRVSVPLPKFCKKLLSVAQFDWNLTVGCWVMVKRISKWRPSAIFDL